jgi:stage 0 sporulation protein B (sporulation initiation phosphotransferase)
LTYNWLNRFLSIEYVVLGDVLNLSKIDEPLTEWTKQFFSLMENLVEPNAENHLMLTIETVGNRTRFLFDFQGILNKEEELTLFLSTKSYDVIHITVLSCSRSQLTVNLEVTNEHMV